MDFTPEEIRKARNSWMVKMGQGRATRKNKKNYGRPSTPERKRAPSLQDLREHMMRKKHGPKGWNRHTDV